MSRRWMTIGWACLGLSLFFGYANLWAHGDAGAPFRGSVVAGATAGAAAMAYLVARVGSFRRGLRRSLRRLLDGQYGDEARIDVHGRDELSRLERDMNEFIGHLEVYDELRAERVRFCHAETEAVFQNGAYGMFRVDCEQGVLTINPVLRAVFGVEQPRFGLPAIECIAENGEFMALIRNVRDVWKSSTEANVFLQLPTRNTRRSLTVKLVPLKDGNGRVPVILGMVSGSQSSGG